MIQGFTLPLFLSTKKAVELRKVKCPGPWYIWVRLTNIYVLYER
jgi:hypothetical protein